MKVLWEGAGDERIVAGGDGRYHSSYLGSVHGVLLRGPSV